MWFSLLVTVSQAAGLADFERFERGFYAPEAVAEGPVRGAARAVVSIGGSSGFFVSPDGLLLTNAHVAEVVGEVGAIRPPWDALARVPVSLVWADEALDMALYQAEVDAPTPFAPLRATRTEVGEAVAVVGHPDGRPLRVSFGHIVDDDGVAQGQAAVTYDAWTGWGSSGSPVIDAWGRVVAVHRAWGWGPGFEGHYIGVPSDVLLEALPAMHPPLP